MSSILMNVSVSAIIVMILTTIPTLARLRFYVNIHSMFLKFVGMYESLSTLSTLELFLIVRYMHYFHMFSYIAV